MSKDKQTGGPAFPTPVHNLKNDGMTLRDYFAAKALQGYVSGVLSDMEMSTHVLRAADRKGLSSEEYFAKKSYELADAMLEARDD